MNNEPSNRNGPEATRRLDAPDLMAVEISDTQRFLRVDSRSLTQLVRGVLHEEGVDRASISVALVDDATIHDINRRHLGHDWPTDVISFPLSDPDDLELVGELVVSAEMAATTAEETGVPAWDELALYVVHGLLHLSGYDDRDDRSRDAMRRREGEILARLGLLNTFPATAGRAGVGTEAGGRERARWTV